jgi:hypothetical protein
MRTYTLRDMLVKASSNLDFYSGPGKRSRNYYVRRGRTSQTAVSQDHFLTHATTGKRVKLGDLTFKATNVYSSVIELIELCKDYKELDISWKTLEKFDNVEDLVSYFTGESDGYTVGSVKSF